MHIARVVHVFYGDIVGDPFNALDLSIRQSISGNRVTLFTWNKENRCPFEFFNQNFKLYRLKGLNLALKPFFTEYPLVPRLGMMLEREKPELVHAHSHLYLTTYTAIKAANRMGIPSIVTVHGVSADRNLAVNLLQKLYLRSLGTRIFQSSTRIVCLTRADAKQVLRLGGPASKIRVIPNAVNAEMFKPFPKKEQDNLVVWIGRFVPEKGLKILIEAAKHVRSHINDVKFILVGDGPLRNELEHLIKVRGLTNHMSLIGPLKHEEVADVLAKASIFTFPSIKEGMPKAVLEAMAAGKAVVASDIPGMDEIIESGFNGVLVQPRNASALGDTIIALLNDKRLRKSLGRNARQAVIKHFSWDNVLSLLSGVYEEAAAEI